MRLGVCTQALYNLPFREALEVAGKLGFETVELPVDGRSPWFDLNELLKGGWRELAANVREAGLAISALSNHQEGQLLLGPHGSDTDVIFPGSPEEKSAYGAERLKKTAALAQLLEVPVVTGFMGCEDYSRFFPWPDASGYERMAATVPLRLGPVLDEFQRRGVRFAHECHPKQFAYNLETAEWTLELLNHHAALAFNFDPANLLLAGMDPICFIASLGARIAHVHAKDGEKVRHNVARSGLLAHGRWDRPDRGFRFRVAGWGELSWKAIISELQIAGFDGVLSVEHEDPTMDRIEGLEKAMETLRPLLLRRPRGEAWW